MQKSQAVTRKRPPDFPNDDAPKLNASARVTPTAYVYTLGFT